MVTRVIIFGNSGAGKSWLAERLANQHGLVHLDLDSLAWMPQSPPRRRHLEESFADIKAFMHRHSGWVIEGCYADLLGYAANSAEQAVFLDLPVAQCIKNAKGREWEPHKYASKSKQDANLAMLLTWIAQYEKRDDTFSRRAHQSLFDAFAGSKTRYTAAPGQV